MEEKFNLEEFSKELAELLLFKLILRSIVQAIRWPSDNKSVRPATESTCIRNGRCGETPAGVPLRLCLCSLPLL